LRQGQKIHLENENHARGVVTSGTYSPTLKKPIALVRMPKTDSKSCYAEIRGKKIEATIGSPKFIKEGQTIFKERA
jgi:aminomethyltransferase